MFCPINNDIGGLLPLSPVKYPALAIRDTQSEDAREISL
jgi:hypothetical protein